MPISRWLRLCCDAADVQALKEGLRDGIIDAISTDHAPHSVEEKTNPEFAKNANGIVGLETPFRWLSVSW